LVFFKIVIPAPDPRRVIGLCINKKLFTINVPGLSITTWLEGQLSNFAWIAAESFSPLGDSVAQMIVRLGTPPLDIIPGFQENILSAGIIPDICEDGAPHDDAVVALLLPAQDQCHGPLPVTAEGVPRLQSPVLGAVLSATPLAGPHGPFTAEDATGAKQLAVVPPLLLVQDEFDGPLAENCLDSPALETETSTSIVELPGALLVAPDTISEKKSRPP
jgi:hypothetical protein